MADDYEFGASYESTPAVEFDFDSFMAGIVNSLPPTEQQVAASLGGNDIETYFGSVSGGPTIGGVASGAAPDPKKEPSMISKFWGSLSADDKKIGLSVLGMLGGGLANIGAGKRKDRELNIMESRATADTEFNRARIALEQQRLANGSAIGQTNFGTATQPMGMINAPVTLTRNRLKPTPGMPA